MKCPNCGFDRILPMYKVCPKCKQPLNTSNNDVPKTDEPQPAPNTKLFTGIFWSYQKAIKDPVVFQEYAQKNPNDSARLINKWKEKGYDVTALVKAHPMNSQSEKPTEVSSPRHETTVPKLTPAERTKTLSAEHAAKDVDMLSIGKQNKKHYVSWTIPSGQIARNISAQEFLEMSSADGVYVQEGVTAVLFIDGIQAAEMEGGVYTFATEKTQVDARKEKEEEEAEIRAKEGLIQKLGRLGRSVANFFYHSHDAIREKRRKNKDLVYEHIRRITSTSIISVVLKRDGVVNFVMGIRPVASEDGNNTIEFTPFKIKTRSLTIDVAVAMEARIYDFYEFRTTYLMDRNSYAINDLRVALNTFMRTTIQREMQNYTADGDLLPQELMASISYQLMTQSKELLHGISISNVLDITTENEAFDRFRAIEEKLFCTDKEIDYLTRTNEFKNRLQLVENQQKVTEAKTELDLRKELDQINNDQLIHEDEMESFVELLQSQKRIREVQTENDELEELLKLKGNRLVSEDELEAIEDSIRNKKFDREQVSAEFQMKSVHRTNMTRAQLDFQLHKNQLLSDAELNDIRFEELRKDQVRQFQLEDSELEHNLSNVRRQDEYDDARREKDAEFADSRREKDAEFADSRREKELEFEQRQKDIEYARAHREAQDSFNIEKERSQNEMDILRQKAEIARQNMLAMQQHEQEMAEKKHKEELARIAAQQNMSAEQLMATKIAEMDVDAQKTFAESLAAGKGSEKEREMYERMLKMQADSNVSNQSQQAAMMQQMMTMMQSAMQTNASMATNMAAGQSAQQQANLDAIQNVAGARVSHTEDLKEEYRKQMEHEQQRTDATQEKALNYTTRVSQEEIKSNVKSDKVEIHTEQKVFYLPDFGAEYTLKEVGNFILNGTIDPETELEVNGEPLTVAEVDELLPFLEKKYGGE